MTYSYTVTRVRGCAVIDRPIPVDDITALMGAWGKDSDPNDPWHCDAILAQHFSAALIAGPLSVLMAWRRELGLEQATMKGDDEADRT